MHTLIRCNGAPSPFVLLFFLCGYALRLVLSVWHWCLPNGQKFSFLCPNGTVFNQFARVCDWWFNVDCAATPNLYNINEDLSSASEYGVGRSTIYDIKRNHEKIKKFVSSTDCGPGKRQTLKKAEHPEVEEGLYMWFLQERNRHAPISGPMLAMKAKFFYKKITKEDDFVASKGWL
ncbi:unnamed protein product [Acanthoscelides obtectus]|uniref:HTH CENPB-type domain-containing protein n=1 Tax=Acanthoscelides obtectus TaxID=200917 RepID=A0A9P0M919_ACAOB|nr:unnamed protein product [Acanthoscelides obtectus]CAK1658594.1 Tigger transposable element-derived protein 2 [Acanthoscelides obtectus]